MSRKRWISASVSESTWDAYHALAGMVGKQPRTMLEEIMDTGIETLTLQYSEKGKAIPIDLRLWFKLRELAVLQRERDRLDKLGYFAKQTGDETLMDEFEKFCIELNLDAKHVLDNIDMDRMPQPTDLEEKGTSVQECATWLAKAMLPGVEYPASEMQFLGKKRGYSRYSMDEAKKELGIESKKKGTHWVWRLPKSLVESIDIVTEVESVPDEQVDARKPVDVDAL